MKFTIISINLNNKTGLVKTRDSISTQTFRDFEWIVIDGGSTDGSEEYIKEHTDEISYWVSEKDKGIYNAMNKGIAQAKGEYINFLNSGDYYYDETVLQQIFDMKSNADVINGLAWWEDKSKILQPHRTDILAQMMTDTVNHQASFIKRELFNNTLYREDIKIISDWYFFFQKIIIERCSLRFTDINVALMKKGGISSVSTDSGERDKALQGFFPQTGVYNALKRYYEITSWVSEKDIQQSVYIHKNSKRLSKLLTLITNSLYNICDFLVKLHLPKA